MERVDRRTFLKRGFFAILGVVALPSVLACAPEEQPQVIITPDRIQPEQLQLLQDKTWQSLTNVLKEDFFSQDSLKIDHLVVTKGHNPKIAGEEVHVVGSLNGQVSEGHTSQLGVQFRITYAKDVTFGQNQRPLDLNIEGNGLAVGEELGKGLELGYFIGENAGEVFRRALYADVVRNPQGMQKRFEDMQAELKKVLKIPDNTPFIPEQDFNGLVTFVGNRTGYGLYMESAREGIEGKGVTINMTEGLLTDNLAWTDIARRYHNYVRPDQISFKEILRVALDNLGGKPSSGLLRSFRQVDKDNAHAAEYIRQLGIQYLPNQNQVSVDSK